MPAATDRLEFRLPPTDKSILARAAEIEGIKLSQFLLGPALKRARKVIAEAEQITTTADAYEEVLDALVNPAKPNKALKQAMREYEAARITWRD